MTLFWSLSKLVHGNYLVTQVPYNYYLTLNYLQFSLSTFLKNLSTLKKRHRLLKLICYKETEALKLLFLSLQT